MTFTLGYVLVTQTMTFNAMAAINPRIQLRSVKGNLLQKTFLRMLNY